MEVGEEEQIDFVRGLFFILWFIQGVFAHLTVILLEVDSREVSSQLLCSLEVNLSHGCMILFEEKEQGE